MKNGNMIVQNNNIIYNWNILTSNDLEEFRGQKIDWYKEITFLDQELRKVRWEIFSIQNSILDIESGALYHEHLTRRSTVGL